MIISIDHVKHFDWEDAPAGFAPTPEQVASLDFKQDAAGTWKRKVVVERETHTDIRIPEPQLEQIAAGQRGKGKHWDRARCAAWLLEEHVMPNHAQPEHFVKIHVDGEPEMEAALTRFFNVGGAQ